jgi:hypothetical protein
MLAYMNDTSSPLNAYPAFAAAKVDGPMKAFNAEYRRRRLAAREAGESFVSYRAAEQRLRKAIIGIAAGKTPPSIVARVFEDGLPDPQ